MVKLEDGFMVAFGGTFCIRVPVEVDIKACFSPSKAAVFFRKPRKVVSYTLQKNKLVLKEGKEKLSIPYLDADEMATLDVLGQATPCELDMGLLKLCADVIDPESPRPWAQGVSFRNGVMESTNSVIIVSAVSGVDEDLEFNLPLETCKAIVKFTSPVTGVSSDGRMVKVFFADGSSLTSLCIAEQMIDTSNLFKDKWTDCGLVKNLADDLHAIQCEKFRFEDGCVTYIGDDMEGVLGEVFIGKCSFLISKKNIDFATRVGQDIRLSSCGSRIMSVSENCRVIAATRVNV